MRMLNLDDELVRMTRLWQFGHLDHLRTAQQLPLLGNTRRS